ncbi:MAG: hypothetical protein ACW98I_17670 [Candidatus Hodarchaeales archaeon]|jgi:hypothetical protein
MATDTVNPELLPCPNVPKKQLLDGFNLSKRSFLILGLLFILLIASIPRGLTPYPDPPVSSGSDTISLVSTGDGIPSLLKKGIKSKEDLAEFIQTTDGGFALAINTRFEVTGDRDTMLVKTDMNGTVQWSQTYEGNSSTHVGTLIQTIDSGYLLVGYTYEGGKTPLWLVKTDPGGKVEWSKSLKYEIPVSSTGPIVYNVVQSKDGGFIFAGCSLSVTENRQQIWLLKTDDKGTMEWTQTYRGAKEYQDVHDLIQTEDDGFAFAGATFSGVGGTADVQLVKTDSKGVMEWTQTYGGAKDDWAYSLIQTEDAGFALAGETQSINVDHSWPKPDMLLVKTDSNGVIEWDQTYGGNESDAAYSLLQTTEGGYTLAGNTHSESTNSEDMFLVKTNANGVMEWNKTYGGLEDDEAVAIIQAVDSGFMIAGVTNTYYSFFDEWRLTEHLDADTWLMKTDENGSEEWKRIFEGTVDEEWATDLIQTVDGDFVFSGSVGTQNLGRKDACLVKINEDGLLIWNQTYGGTEEEYPESIIQTKEGGFVIAGSTNSLSAGKSDVWLVKTDETGLLIWNQTYGGLEEDGAEAVIQTNDGGFAIAGFTRSQGAGNSDAWIIKTDRNGVVEWNQTFGGINDDNVQNIIQLANGSFVLSGYIGQYVNASSHSGFACWHWETFDQAWLLVLDENGVMHQNFTYEQPGSLRFHDLMKSDDDSIIIAGLTTPQGDPSDWMLNIGHNSLFYLRLDEAGIYQWIKTLPNEFPMGDLIFTTDGFILTAYVEADYELGTSDYHSVVKLDSTGLVQWTLNFTENNFKMASVLIPIADGGYALAGGLQSRGLGGDSVDVWLSKIAGNGTLLWEQTYGITGGITSDGWEWHHNPSFPTAASFTPWYLIFSTLITVTTIRSAIRGLKGLKEN